MKLDDFVSETIFQVIKGVKDSQERIKKVGGIVVPYRAESIPATKIKFNVAVSTVSEKGTEGKAGIFVGPIGLGTGGHSESTDSTVSRIDFEVAVTFPSGI